MHATAILGSLLRDSMMRAKAGPRKATVCIVFRTRVRCQPCLMSLSANSPAPKLHTWDCLLVRCTQVAAGEMEYSSQ